MIQIIPAIDIIDGKCVRLTKGDYEQKKVYNDNPLDVAKMFQDKGIKRLHLVDLDGARSRHIVNYKVIEAIASHTDLVIDFGGGIKTDEDLQIAFNSGAQMITAGSIAVTGHNIVSQWIKTYGPERIILGADTRNGKISINPIGNIHIGDELSIAGTTNYKDSDTFSLNIRLLNFEPVRNTEAMQMTALRTTPQNNSFTFDKIDTSTWVPGTYMAEVTNINTGCSDSVTFDVTSADIAEDTTETADLEPKSTPLPIDTPTPVTFKPTPTKASSSPISLLTVSAGLAAAWFALRRK